MLNHPRRLTLPRPTAAPTATQLRVVLTLHLLLLQISAGTRLEATASESLRLATQGAVLSLAQGGVRDYVSFSWSASLFFNFASCTASLLDMSARSRTRSSGPHSFEL